MSTNTMTTLNGDLVSQVGNHLMMSSLLMTTTMTKCTPAITIIIIIITKVWHLLQLIPLAVSVKMTTLQTDLALITVMRQLILSTMTTLPLVIIIIITKGNHLLQPIVPVAVVMTL